MPEIEESLPVREEKRPRRLTKPRVYMLDILPTVPYYTGYLCAALEKLGTIDVEVGSADYYLDRDFFERRGLRNRARILDLVSRFPRIPSLIRRSLKAAEYLTNVSTLAWRMRFSKPEVVHVQFLPLLKASPPVELWMVKALRRLGTKIVYTVHNVLPHERGEIHRARYKECYQLADRLICHDVEAKQRLVDEFSIEPSKISVIPHGPLLEPMDDTPQREETRARWGAAPGEHVVLWQGIIRPYKGISFLLKAWQQVMARGAKSRLVIAGTGDAEILTSIRQEVKDLGVEDSVSLDLRFLSVTEVAQYYASADVITYPYRDITTSGALMTGICYGKAIVATRQPGFRKVLDDNKNALLVDYGNVEDLADKLLALLANESLRRKLGEAAHKTFLEGPQWEGIARDTMACYQLVLSENPHE